MKSLRPMRFFEINRPEPTRVSSRGAAETWPCERMPYLTAIRRRHLLTVVKAMVSVAAIVFIVSRFDLPLFLSHWHKLNLASVLIVLAVLAIETTLVAGTRLKLVLAALGAYVPLARTSRIALCGFFVEQVAFGFVGGTRCGCGSCTVWNSRFAQRSKRLSSTVVSVLLPCCYWYCWDCPASSTWFRTSDNRSSSSRA